MDRLEQIILATLELASINGLGNVSLQMIADKVGIRKASLFNHIESKDDLLDKMYIYLREQAKDRLVSPKIDLNKDVEAVFLEAYHNYLAICQNDKLNVFYKLIYSERAFNDKAKELVVEETNTMVQSIRELFGQLEKMGRLKLFNIEQESIEFAFTLHNFIDYELDINGLGIKPMYKIEEYIRYFVEVHHV